MKWIKTFEELKPGTYRNAARKFQDWNKSNRSDQLYDWADKQEYGFYNLHVGAKNGRSDRLYAKNFSFTMPRLLGVYYGYKTGGSLPVNLLDTSNREEQIELLSNRMVNDWVEGDVNYLSIMFEFGFKPTKESIEKETGFKNIGYSNNSLNSWNGKNRYTGNILPTFRINLLLTDETWGKEGYYEEWKYETEREGKEWTEPSVYTYYEDTKYNFITLNRPFSDNSFGIFSDRKSALKFKEYFLSIVNSENESLRGLDIKSLIMDVLSIVGGESSDIERIMSKLRGIRIHGLYDDEITNSTSNFSRRWYDTDESGLEPWGKIIN